MLSKHRRAPVHESDIIGISAPFQIKCPKFLTSRGIGCSQGIGIEKDQLGKPESIQDLSLRVDSHLNENVMSERITKEQGGYGVELIGYINPDIFPPRGSCPFLFFPHKYSNFAQDWETLHPLEIVPKDFHQWIQPSDISNSIEVKLPLEFFDEITPNLDPFVQYFINCLQSSTNKTCCKEPCCGWSRYYALDGRFRWEKCEILDYDRLKDLFHIRWLSTSSNKWVKRLNLLFDKEDKSAFQLRIRAARLQRTQINRELERRAFVNDRVVDRPSNLLDEESCQRITNRVNPSSKAIQFSEKSLMEVKDLCLHCLKEISVQMLYIKPATNRASDFEGFRDMKIEEPVPKHGCVKLSEACTCEESTILREKSDSYYNKVFAELVVWSEKNLLVANSCILNTVQTYIQEWNLSSMSLFRVDLEQEKLPFELEEFSDIQETYLIDTTDIIRSDWVYKTMSLTESLTLQGRDTKSSDNELKQEQANVSEAEIIRIAKFFSLMMTDQLTSVVKLSLSDCEQFWSSYADEHNSGAESYLPLFTVGIVWDGTHFEFEPKLQKFQDTALAQLDGILKLTSDVSDISEKIKNAASDKTLPALDFQHPLLFEIKKQIRTIFRKHEQSLMKELQELNKFQSLAEMKEEHLKVSFDSDVKDAVASEISNLDNVIREVEACFRNEVSTSLYKVEFGSIKEWLKAKAKKQRCCILAMLEKDLQSQNEQLTKQFLASEQQLSSVASSIEDVCKIKQNCCRIENDLQHIQQDIDLLDKKFSILHENRIIMDDELIADYWRVKILPKRMRRRIYDTSVTLTERLGHLKIELIGDLDNLEIRVSLLQSKIEQYSSSGDFNQCEEKVENGTDLKRELDELKALSDLYQNRLLAIEMPTKSVDSLLMAEQRLCSQLDAWNLVVSITKTVSSIKDKDLDAVDAAETRKMTESWQTELQNVAAVIDGSVSSALTETRIHLETFIQQLPLLEALANKNLNDRHWKAISEAIGLEFDLNDETTLQNLLDLGISQITKEVQAQSEIATTEAEIKLTLEELEDSWDQKILQMTEFSDIGCPMLSNVAELEENCLEDLNKLRSIKALQATSFFDVLVSSFEQELTQIKEMLATWKKCQDYWMRLKPFINEGGLPESCPNEYQKLAAIDALWKNLMGDLESSSQPRKLIKNPDLLNTLTDSLIILAKIADNLQ